MLIDGYGQCLGDPLAGGGTASPSPCDSVRPHRDGAPALTALPLDRVPTAPGGIPAVAPAIPAVTHTASAVWRA